MKSVYYLILPLSGPALARVSAIQEKADPRLAREWPPHATLAGSSGMGPIPGEVDVGVLRRTLEEIAASTPPIELPFEAPTRFMQSNVVVLPLNPHGPLRELHERIKTSGLPFAPPRFAFTPHVTLSFYPELTPQRGRDLLVERVTEPARFESISVYRSFLNRTSRHVMTIDLEG